MLKEVIQQTNEKIYRNKLIKSKIELSNDEDSDISEDDNEYIDNKLNKIFKNYDSDLISKYIVNDRITKFNSKAYMCYYLWSGINKLDRWELNRKIDNTIVNKIYNEMVEDYKKLNEFIFYDPVHLALKKNSIFYVIDGQHRLTACSKLYKKNKYPIQQIPCVIWFPKSEEEFIDIFDRINSRTPIDRTKLFNYKINEIIKWFDETWGKDYIIWGKIRPKIN